MPAPYAGQQWKHGWIPLTPAAAVKKNHGHKPGEGSKVSQMMDDALRERATKLRSSTGGGRRKGGRIGAEPPGGWSKADEIPETQRRIRTPSEPDIKYKGNNRWGVGKQGSQWIVQDRETGKRYSFRTKMAAEMEAERREKRYPPSPEDLGDGWGLRRTRRGWQLYRRGIPLGDHALYTSRDAAIRAARGEDMAHKRVYATAAQRRRAREHREQATRATR